MGVVPKSMLYLPESEDLIVSTFSAGKKRLKTTNSLSGIVGVKAFSTNPFIRINKKSQVPKN